MSTTASTKLNLVTHSYHDGIFTGFLYWPIPRLTIHNTCLLVVERRGPVQLYVHAGPWREAA